MLSIVKLFSRSYLKCISLACKSRYINSAAQVERSHLFSSLVGCLLAPRVKPSYQHLSQPEKAPLCNLSFSIAAFFYLSLSLFVKDGLMIVVVAEPNLQIESFEPNMRKPTFNVLSSLYLRASEPRRQFIQVVPLYIVPSFIVVLDKEATKKKNTQRNQLTLQSLPRSLWLDKCVMREWTRHACTTQR